MLGAFEQAVADRAQWVVENRRAFKATVTDPATGLETLRDTVDRMDRTLTDLQRVCDDLRKLILDAFPLEPAAD